MLNKVINLENYHLATIREKIIFSKMYETALELFYVLSK